MTAHARTGLALATLALLVGAGVLITHPAARHSLWYDEAWSVQAISSRAPATIVAIVRADYHSPAYFLALSAWASLTGLSEVALRYSSVLCALLAAAVVYRLTVDLYRARAAGAFAALALCTMPFHIRFAQELRMYAALALLVAASMWLYWRCLAQSAIQDGGSIMRRQNLTPKSPLHRLRGDLRHSYLPPLHFMERGRRPKVGGGEVEHAERSRTAGAPQSPRWKASLTRPRRATALAYVLATAAAIYVQYLALFVIPIQLAYAVAVRWRERTQWRPLWPLALPLVAGLLFLPWLPTFLAQLTSAEYVPIHSHALPTSLETITNTLSRDFFAGQAVLYLALCAVALLARRGQSALPLRIHALRAVGFLAAWGVGWLALMWVSNLLAPHYQPRNALPALPALAILVGVGLNRLPRWLGVALLALLVAGNLTGYNAFQAADPHYRDAVTALARAYQPGDPVFVQTNNFLHDLPLAHYLDTLLPPHPEPAWFSALAGGWSPGSEAFAAAFAAQVGAHDRFWLLQTLPVDNAWIADAAPGYVEVSNVHVDAFQIARYEMP